MENISFDDIKIVNASKEKNEDYFNWDSIKVNKSRTIQKNIDEWANKDFYNHIIDTIKATPGVSCNIANKLAGCSFIKNTRSKFKEDFGIELNNRQMLDYINSILEFEFKTRKVNFFDFKIIYNSARMKFYFNNILGKNKSINIVNNVNKDNKADLSILGIKSLKASYSLNFSNFIKKFGFVIAANYMINYEDMQEEEALEKIFLKIEKNSLSDAKYWEEVINSTKKYGPYHVKCKLKSIKKRVDDIKNKLGLKNDSFSLKFCKDCDIPEYIRKENK